MPRRDHHLYHVYIMTNAPRGVLYVGMTGGLDFRVGQHKTGHGAKFTKLYRARRLVYWEDFQYVNDALAREKQLKNWRRDWKIDLVEADNPDWQDLAADWKLQDSDFYRFE